MQIIESVGSDAKNGLGDVKIVQTLLNSKGFRAGRVDGFCGDKTIAAIRAFQATFLTAPDGVVEPTKSTWRHLVRPGATMPAHAPLAKWAGESSKWPQEKKLESMHPDLRPKVSAVLLALANRDFQPTIFFGWRSVAVNLPRFFGQAS